MNTETTTVPTGYSPRMISGMPEGTPFVRMTSKGPVTYYARSAAGILHHLARPIPYDKNEVRQKAGEAIGRKDDEIRSSSGH